MVSSATAGNVRQLNKTDEILKTSEVDEPYIDPDLYLTKDDHLSILEEAQPTIEDHEIKLVADAIIEELGTKEYVDNTDMENILNTLNLRDIFIRQNRYVEEEGYPVIWSSIGLIFHAY